MLPETKRGKLSFTILNINEKTLRQGAQARCTGMTQRDGMGRVVGGEFRMQNTCKPMADSYQCMAKITTTL